MILEKAEWKQNSMDEVEKNRYKSTKIIRPIDLEQANLICNR